VFYQLCGLSYSNSRDGRASIAISNGARFYTGQASSFHAGPRFWIERAFEDAKSELGMSHINCENGKVGIITWLSFLGSTFSAAERIENAEEFPLLSAGDWYDAGVFFTQARQHGGRPYSDNLLCGIGNAPPTLRGVESNLAKLTLLCLFYEFQRGMPKTWASEWARLILGLRAFRSIKLTIGKRNSGPIREALLAYPFDFSMPSHHRAKRIRKL